MDTKQHAVQPGESRTELSVMAHVRYQAAVDEYFKNFFSVSPGTAGTELPNTLQLLISEAFTNVARHAYSEDNAGIVRIAAKVDGDKVTITVMDTGASFDPDSVPEPVAASLQVGGYGLFIIKSQVDHFSYEPCDGKNIMTLVKTI